MPDIKPFSWVMAVNRALAVLVSLAGLGFLAMFYGIAYRRVRFPLQIEWAEGGMMDAVRRAAAHQAIYVAPGKSYIPYIYTPLYYYASAWMSHLTGLNLFSMRLVSVLSTTACFLVIFLSIKRFCRSNFAAWLGTTLFAAFYARSGTWFDLGRVDMLYLALLLFAIYLSMCERPILAAIVFVLAFQTKQTALPIAVLVLAHEYRRPGKLVAGLGTFSVIAGLSTWWINHQSHGWFAYYTSVLPARHAWWPGKFFDYWLHDLLDPLSIALVIMATAAAFHFSAPGNRRLRLLVGVTTAGLCVSCLAARLNVGGNNNVTLPLQAWLCILFGVGVSILLKKTEASEAGSNSELNIQPKPALRMALLAGCLMQFAHLIYSPGYYIPTAQQRIFADQFVARVRDTPGNFFVMHDGLDAGTMGKPTYASSMGIWYVLSSDHGPAGQALRQELIEAFRQKEFAGVISDGPLTSMTPEEANFIGDITSTAATAYPRSTQLMTPLESLQIYTNLSTQDAKPQFLYLPK